MTNLKAARKGKLEDFIKEHEADESGDLDKLDAALKRPVQGSESKVPATSSEDASDD